MKKPMQKVLIILRLMFFLILMGLTNVQVFASLKKGGGETSITENLTEYESAQIEQLQQKEITGKVTDISGQPLPGVTVIIKGTTRGTD